MGEHALETVAPADSPDYTRVTVQELEIMRSLRKAGKSQTYIAQQLGRSQSTVSFWLNELTDTTDIATEYLRGKALHMAKNVVENGQPRDHIQALKGVGSLQADRSDVNIAIGISLPGMPTLSARETVASTLSPHQDGSN